MKEDRLSMMFVADIEAPAPESVSNSFEKYAHFRDLNTGGKAVLTLCRDTNLGRDVVLKRLRPEFRDDKVELRRLLREAKITAQLQHPATVPLYELGIDDQGDFYFAMKNIVGHTLFEIICALARREKDAESHFSLNRLLAIFTQVGEAIHYAHVRGIIHRDIKPENVIVGMFGEVNLIDWGRPRSGGCRTTTATRTVRTCEAERRYTCRRNKFWGTATWMSAQPFLAWASFCMKCWLSVNRFAEVRCATRLTTSSTKNRYLQVKPRRIG